MFAKVVPKIIDLLKDQVAGIERKTGSPPKVCQLNTEQGVIILVSLKTFFTGHNPRWRVWRKSISSSTTRASFPQHYNSATNPSLVGCLSRSRISRSLWRRPNCIQSHIQVLLRMSFQCRLGRWQVRSGR
jgi:hypothetical protein